MSRRTRSIGLLVLVAILLIFGIYWFVRDDEMDTVRVERGSLDVTIETVGRLTPEDEVVARAEVSGQVAQLGARSGDRVESGDILVMLDVEPLERAVVDAERAVERAEFTLQAAEAAVDEDDSAEHRLALIDATAGVESAERALDRAREALGNAAIIAPQEGIVIAMLVTAGDVVGEAQPVARLAPPSGLELIADVDELDLPNVSPGAQVNFRVDSYPASEISGTVVDTAPAAQQQGGATVFPTRIRFDAPDDLDLRPGMNANVTIITDERSDVLLLPDAAIRTVGERNFVEVLRNGDPQEVEVVTGFRSSGMVEVLSGIEEDEEIVLP